ncbi:MAG: ABC transporter ATP-binding protein [Pseudonocardiales bacterium]|nr:MAG: ABC transporter ATP-binding protein [Pseudonocardiales bacterium]
MTAALDARVEVVRDGFTVDVALSVPAGGVVALLGPNGAGKSTVLRAVAGLLRLSSGHVRVDGGVLEDATTGVRLPPERRPAALVFQDYLLFPHLSARDNIAFGLRARGVGRRAAHARADALLTQIGLADRADARPGQLSGGQAQRVALARALAVDPRLLLLDEPLAALDAGTRMVVRTELRHRLDGFDGATVLVTHDPLDALVLADTLVVIEAGAVVQAGSPAEVARRPLTDYVARLVGLNLLAGTTSGTDVRLDHGGHLATTSPHSGLVYIAVRPSAVALHLTEPHGSPRNVWRGVVSGLELNGDGVRVAVAGPPDVLVDVTAAAVADLGLRPGAHVWCAVKATDLESYPR